MAGLLSRLFGKREALTLGVEGVITESGSHQPRTRLGPELAAEEAYFTVDIARAWLSDGAQQAVDTIRPNEFSGDLNLLEQFQVGDRVRIACTTASGRLIASMDKLPT